MPFLHPRIYLILLLLISEFISCQSKQHRQPIEPPAKDISETKIPKADLNTLPPESVLFKNDTIIEGQSQMAYIKSFYKRNDTCYIDADYIEFLTGDEAFETAKKHGELDTGYNADGTIANVGVDDDYYILNDNKKIRRLRLSKTIVIETIFWGEETYYLHRTTFDSLYHVYKSDAGNQYIRTPFSLTIRNGEIVKIEEVYVP